LCIYFLYFLVYVFDVAADTNKDDDDDDNNNDDNLNNTKYNLLQGYFTDLTWFSISIRLVSDFQF